MPGDSVLVLSLFPGLDLLGMAFEREGFCVVRGPDPIFGGDVRLFRPPRGRFSGIIGGPPCQAHSSLAFLTKAKGGVPSFGDMTPEYVRVVREADPEWFLYENVRRAPVPRVPGYELHSFLLNNRHVDRGDGVGPVQNRVRLFAFGSRSGLKIFPPLCVLDNPEKQWAVLASELSGGDTTKRFVGPGVKRVGGAMKGRRSFEDICELQGLPRDFDVAGWTKIGKGRAVGNGVPLFMGRSVARAIRLALGLPVVSETA